MNKTIAIALVVLSVLAVGAVGIALNAPEVAADSCGGPGQPPCTEYCAQHPLDPICREGDSK